MYKRRKATEKARKIRKIQPSSTYGKFAGLDKQKYRVKKLPKNIRRHMGNSLFGAYGQYKGGLVYVDRDILRSSNGTKLDVNSLYPTVMK